MIGAMNGDSTIAQDYAIALKYFEDAAAQKHVNALNNLGEMYRLGKGVPINLNKAFSLYEKAAEQDCAVAQFNLAECYEHGYGVLKDDPKAIEWYEKAALGYPDALNCLAERFLEGRGKVKNEQEALKLLLTSKQQNGVQLMLNINSLAYTQLALQSALRYKKMNGKL